MINEWYRQAFEINTSIKLIINPENGNIVDANQAACDFYGYTKDEILHLKISDINCLSKQELIKEMELAKSEKRLYFLFQHKLKSGEIRDVEVYSGPITKDGETLLHSIIHDITEKNKFQRELKKNQAILRAMLDHTTSLIALLDKEGRRIIVNDRISQVFHSNEENLKGTLFWDVPWINYSESQVKKIQKAIKKCSEGIAANIPIEIIINNKTRILELHLNPVKNESNDVEYILAEGIEITERIQFEKDLRSSKQKAEEYSELLNSILESPEGIIVFSIDKNFKYTSFTAHHKEIMKNIWGKDIELGKSILEYITFPEDREKAKKNFQKALKGEHLTIIEEYGDHKLERTYWENRYSPIYSKDNKIKGITVFVLNITDRKKAESDLYLASQVFKQSSEAIMITDRNKELLLINSAFEILTGYSEEEVIGKDPKFLNSNSDDENFYDNIWKIIDSKGNWQGEVFIRKKDGKAFPANLLISSLKDENRIITNYIGICKDLTENKNKEEYILKLSYFDPVTGLPNRVLIMEKINNLITDSNKHTKFAILILDLDKFKNINDTLGHGVGNKLLVQVANRLRDIFKNDYNLSRIGGDEFMILLNYSEEEEIIHISETLLKRISENYKLDNLDLKITTSIGIAFYPKDGKDPETLTKSADTAMYRAKETRNSYRFFTLEMEDQIKHILEIENLLHKALENDEFSVFYQPQISLETMKIVGAESLIRWKTNSGQVISPSEFIPLAEENGLIIPIGSWILETTILQMLDFEKNGIYLNNISVNVSAAQFKHNEFLNSIFQTIDKYKIDPSKLELEITESIAMENPDMVVEITKKLKEKKIKLSIDDFGTGYSSLSYLKKFHLDKIKIDQSFVKGLGSSQDDEVIVSAIINLANSLKFDIIAEGVENKKQLEFLKQRNCNLIQGYYFSKPLNSKDFFSLVKKFNKL